MKIISAIKYILLPVTILTLLFISKAPAQALQWDWTTVHGSIIGFESPLSLLSDTKGNIITLQTFDDSLEWATTEKTPLKLTKYNSNGQMIWEHKISGKNYGFDSFSWPGIFGLAIDSNDNIVMLTRWDSVFYIDGTPIDNLTYPGALLVKFSSNGSLEWANTIQGIQADSYGDLSSLNHVISIDKQGNIILTGRTTLSIDTTVDITINGINYIKQSVEGRAECIKFMASGEVDWVKVLDKAEWVHVKTSAGIAVAFDQQDNIFILGRFDDDFSFGETHLTPYGSDDIFLAKLSPSGSIIWVKQIGGIDRDDPVDLISDNSGGIYVSAGVVGEIHIPGMDSLSKSNSPDFLLVKFDANGNQIWHTRNYGLRVNDPSNVAIDQTGLAFDAATNTIITGAYVADPNYSYEGVALDNYTPNTSMIVSYSVSGEFNWLFPIVNYDNAFTLITHCTDQKGNYYIGGSLGKIDENWRPNLDSTTILTQFGKQLFKTQGGFDAAIGKLIPATSSVTTTPSASSASFFPNPMTSLATISLDSLPESGVVLELHDILGKEVYSAPVISGQKSITFSRAGISSGVYYYQLRSSTALLNRGRVVIE